MLKEDIEKMDPEIRKKLDVGMAVALLEMLHLQGEISDKTLEGIKKSSQKILDSKDDI